MIKRISKVFSIILLALVMLTVTGCGNNKAGEKLKTNEDIKSMVETITTKEAENLPQLNVIDVDLKDSFSLSSFIGIETSDNIEEVVAVEPFISSIPFSLAFARVSEDADIEKMKSEILEKINMRKWLCVEADKLYVFNNGNTIVVLMASKDSVDIVYNDIKEYLENNIGEVLEKTGSNYENIEE